MEVKGVIVYYMTGKATTAPITPVKQAAPAQTQALSQMLTPDVNTFNPPKVTPVKAKTPPAPKTQAPKAQAPVDPTPEDAGDGTCCLTDGTVCAEDVDCCTGRCADAPPQRPPL
mgnify:CR=1 FL=1